MKFETRRIAASEPGALRPLAAIQCEGRLHVVFRSGLNAMPTIVGAGFTADDLRQIGGGARISGAWDGKVAPSVAGAEDALEIIGNEQALFEGLNAAIVLRAGESVATTVDWLRYHSEGHGLEAALIVDTTGPEADTAFADDLRDKLDQSGLPKLRTIVVLSSAVPMGKPDFGPAAHPYNAPDAPGKDRMAVPAFNRWTAPFGEPVLFELVRYWFLDKARAVMSLEMSDLVLRHKGVSVFETLKSSKTGFVAMVGDRIYPWSLRRDVPASFGDHICRRFDGNQSNPRWCVDPRRAGADTVWRHIRVAGAKPDALHIYDRCMAIRHPGARVSEIVPKASLVEDDALVRRATRYFRGEPLRAPKLDIASEPAGNSTAIVTTMKNEGPFILEWIAYHRVLGVENFLVYTNDCADGTDDMLKLLQSHGIVQHRENPFRETGLKPQHAALQAAEEEPIMTGSDWVVCMDVDEFMSIHTGEGKLEDLFEAVGDANLISMTWRLFGNSDIAGFEDRLIIDQFTRCAPEFIRKPHQAWGFKTLHRNIGLFKKLGVHRPKGLNPQLVDRVNWVNGSGKPLPRSMYRNAWRSTTDSYGYDLVTLNHYAVRSAESFLVKRDRGRVNHVDRDQGMAYWFRMNNNTEEDDSIQRMVPEVEEELARLKALDGIAEAHATSVARHREKIAELRAREDYAAFYKALTSEKFETLSRIHHVFGRDTFLAGPEVIPDEIVRRDHPDGFFFQPERNVRRVD